MALKKNEEEVSQSDKFKIQFQSVKEIKKYIDKYGSRVVDLPSTLQLLKAKVIEGGGMKGKVYFGKLERTKYITA